MPSSAVYGLVVVLALSLTACGSEPASTVSAPAGGSGGSIAMNGSGGMPPAQGGMAGGGSGGSAGSGGVATAGTGGAAGASGMGGSGGGVDPNLDPAASRPLAVDAAAACNCELNFTAKSLDPMGGTSTSPTHADDEQHMKFDPTKPTQGKLVIVLGGIGGGPGPGGIYGYAISKGFHAFLVATQTDESSAPDEYKGSADPEANRQVGDARREAWDGVDRVDWLDVKRPDSVERRTELALQHAAEQDPGADWGWYLNDDGSVRWTDVYLVGYSFGAQTIAMVSKYVRIGRGLTTSGPTDEDFPNATWITAPSATPLERLYMMVGAETDYPPVSGDIGDKIETVQNAGWVGEPLNVHPNDAGPFNANILVLVGQGHSEMCAGDGGDWQAICDHGFGVK